MDVSGSAFQQRLSGKFGLGAVRLCPSDCWHDVSVEIIY